MEDNTAGSTILVIDDDENIRNSFIDFLSDLGYEVIGAENGRIGLDLIRTKKPHAFLVDLRMPEMGGLEVLKISSRIAPDTPKIVISGANNIGDAIESLRHGAWDYLVKPIEDLTLLEHTLSASLEKAALIRDNKRYQKHLEQMVRERTAQLEQANTHLSNINTRLKKIVQTTRGLSENIAMDNFGPADAFRICPTHGGHGRQPVPA